MMTAMEVCFSSTNACSHQSHQAMAPTARLCFRLLVCCTSGHHMLGNQPPKSGKVAV